jgi:hypothetical protein
MRNSEELLTEQSRGNRRNKNLFGWAIKGDLLVFLLLLVSSCLIVLFFPHLFVNEDFHATESMHCIIPKSFYHNPDIKIYVCQQDEKTIYYYS